MRLGTKPGVNTDFVLATNTESTLITGTDCTLEMGCSNPVFDPSNSQSENINMIPLLTSVNVSRSDFFLYEFELISVNVVGKELSAYCPKCY
jgi:hypothetical protein